jgi:GLPGLI family protein
MKKSFCLLFLLGAFAVVGAQELKKIDDCSMIFIYNYLMCDEHRNPASVKSHEMTLEVGRLYSKFYNSNQAYADSLLVLYANEPPQTAVMRILSQTSGLSFHPFCSYYVFKNYPFPGTTVFLGSPAFGGSYRVEEKLQFEWEIDNNAKAVILGLNCKKATCHYAGRSYEAWFTPDIPINDGPYKFSGLPGLIVKLTDSNNEHIFELQEIRRVNKPMYFPEKAYVSTTAQRYTKALEASKIPLIEQLESTTSDNPAAIPNAIARVKRRNNFIERY